MNSFLSGLLLVCTSTCALCSVNQSDVTPEANDTTTVQVDTTQTSTTTPYCFEDTVSWEPDISGIVPTHEEDAEACQQKCYDTGGCYHFSFWKKYKLCHLQDAFALRRDYQSNFVSGPFQCWSYLVNAGLVKVGVEQFLPKQFNCMQVGVSWEPVLQWRSGSVLAGKQMDQITACQSLCARTPDCQHFTMDVNTRTCKLAGEDAAPLPGVFNSISGPPVCTAHPRTFMRKFSTTYVDSSERYLVAVAASIMLVAALGSVVALHRRHATRENANSRVLLMAGAVEPE